MLSANNLMTVDYQLSLLDYLKNHEEPVGSCGNLPFRLLNHIIKQEELKADCYDLALTHLSSR